MDAAERLKLLKKFGGNPMHTRLVRPSEKGENGSTEQKPAPDKGTAQNRK